MSQVIFKPAQRDQSRLNLAIAGPSGSGKTVAALRLAYGITGDWGKIFVIDTEHGSASLYQGDVRFGIGQFMHFNMEPPFSPARYIEAMNAAIKAGAEAIVTDQISYAWSGDGGVLSIKEAAERSGKYNNWTAWSVATPEHEKLFRFIIASPVHMICTLRSKMEYEQVVEDGKKKVKKLGMAPIQRSEVEYEWTVLLELDRDSHRAVVSKTRSPVVEDGREYEIDESLGKAFMTWLASAVGYKPVSSRPVGTDSSPTTPARTVGTPVTTVPAELLQVPLADPSLATNDRPWKDEGLSMEDARNIMYAVAVAEYGFADIEAVRTAIRNSGKWAAIPDIATVTAIADYLRDFNQVPKAA